MFDAGLVIRELLEESLAASNDSLFHGTTPILATKILQTDRLEPTTNQNNMPVVYTERGRFPKASRGLSNNRPGATPAETFGGSYVRGVSLTRSWPFVKSWAKWNPFYGSGQGVIFELSYKTIRHNHPVRPVNYWTGSSTEYPLNAPEHRKTEAEEFVPGGIPNLNRHIKAIHITRHTHDALLDIARTGKPGFDNGSYAVNSISQEAAAELLTHPKLKVHD